jgi:hypothetical protein
MLDVAKEVFAEQRVANAKVAVVSGQIENELIIDAFRNKLLQPAGVGPIATEEGLRAFDAVLKFCSVTADRLPCLR